MESGAGWPREWSGTLGLGGGGLTVESEVGGPREWFGTLGLGPREWSGTLGLGCGGLTVESGAGRPRECSRTLGLRGGAFPTASGTLGGRRGPALPWKLAAVVLSAKGKVGPNLNGEVEFDFGILSLSEVERFRLGAISSYVSSGGGSIPSKYSVWSCLVRGGDFKLFLLGDLGELAMI